MRKEISIYPNNDSPVTIQVQGFEELDGKSPEGFWDTQNNRIALSVRLFGEFLNLKGQKEMASFFSHLKKVSPKELPDF